MLPGKARMQLQSSLTRTPQHWGQGVLHTGAGKTAKLKKKKKKSKTKGSVVPTARSTPMPGTRLERSGSKVSHLCF